MTDEEDGALINESNCSLWVELGQQRGGVRKKVDKSFRGAREDTQSSRA